MKNNVIRIAMLSIQVLGHFKAWNQQQLLNWPTQKCKALFQILLIEPGRMTPTDQLMEYLWPELQTQKAKNNLWVSISQLRRVLEPDLLPREKSAYISKMRKGYLFNIESEYWLDSEEFAAKLTGSQLSTNLIENLEAWEAARALYKGDYMEDEPYAEWTQYPRSQWRRRYIQLLSNLADAYGQRGNYKKAIINCHEILSLDKTNEAIYRLLMQYYASLGERSTALKVYEEAVRVLRVELGVEPMSETIDLAREVENLKGGWRISIEQPQKASPFIGRRKELDLFTQLLTRTAVGQGRVLIFTGEPGIGKTRLVQEMISLASKKGVQSFKTQCYQIEQSLPYQPLIDMVRQMMEIDQQWRKLASIWLREISVLVPEVETPMSSTQSPVNLADEPDESQLGRLFQAIFHLVANQAEQNNLVLVIEDIHWADATTLQFLHYLVRHITSVPIALVLTLREESVSAGGELAMLLNNLRQEDFVMALPLARLTLDETRALLANSVDTAPFSEELGRWLYKETAGHPFFYISLLQFLRDESLLEDAASKDWQLLARHDPDLTLPDAIRDSVRARVQRLPSTEREVLEWMAVFGRSLDFLTLQAITNQRQITLLDAVEQLVTKQLLKDDSGHYDFNHNKISEVVYHELSSVRLTLYHRQIGAVLEKREDSADMAVILAYHFENGEDKEKALQYWMEAGEHALSTYAYKSSVHHFKRALALTDESIMRMDAYYGLGHTYMLLDNYQKAAEVIQQGLQLAKKHDDMIRHAKLQYLYAQNANRQHPLDGGEAEVREALRIAEEASENTYLAQSLLLLTEVHESRGDLNNALETATRAQVVSSQLNDFHLEARALVEIGFLNAQRAKFDDAVRVVDRGLELLKGTNDHNAIAYGWNILGRAFGGRGDYSRAMDAFRHSQEEAEKVSDRYLLAQIPNMRGWMYRELGDYKNALKFDQEGVNIARHWGKPSPEISARLNMCLDVLHLGNPGRALEMLEKNETRIDAGAFGFHKWRWQLRLLHARGMCYFALGEPAKALALAEEGLALAKANNISKYVALNHELKGGALAELGSINEAIAEIETAVSISDAIQYQPIRWYGRYQLTNHYEQIGQEKNAQESSSEAEAIIQAIAGALRDQNLRKTFLNTAFSK